MVIAKTPTSPETIVDRYCRQLLDNPGILTPADRASIVEITASGYTVGLSKEMGGILLQEAMSCADARRAEILLEDPDEEHEPCPTLKAISTGLARAIESQR